MEIRPQELVKGVLSYIPGGGRLSHHTGGEHTLSPRYCYTVWLRHLIAWHAAGFAVLPQNVAELGPGRSLGVGLAALLSGAGRYFAFEVQTYRDLSHNLSVFDALVALFKERAALPGDDEFPRVRPALASYAFPAAILTNAVLEEALRPERLERIRAVLRGDRPEAAGVEISYVAPWHSSSTIAPGTIDVILSQAVMEHIDDLPLAYRATEQWLRPGGLMSNTIDFKCHGITRHWAGHFTVPEPVWRLVRGRRPYLINRASYSRQRALAERSGLEIVHERPEPGEALSRRRLAAGFTDLTDADLCTSGVYMLARKPANA